LATYLQRHAAAQQVLIAADETWNDPDLAASTLVYADAAAFCEALTAALPAQSSRSEWLTAWQAAETATLAVHSTALADDDSVSEASVIADLAAMLPDGATLFAGNSMPVRDLDSFFPAGPRSHRFLANRGASGIDGVVSSAMGAAAAGAGRLVLVIGDLSFYHDSNGLLAARRFGLDVTIVLVNNDGGGIFSFLPQAMGGESFEALFGTPHGLDFEPLGHLYGIPYRCAKTREAYRAALAESFATTGPAITEVRTERTENVALHNRVWDAVARALEVEAR
jgi:2-succinyl-5-enolpyruvyl-6-hydroxy-3-cyclohexene-1-carboxylate synthase